LSRDRLDDIYEGLSEDDKIVQEAKDEFKLDQDWEAEFRSISLADMKFANGDSDNGWQWPDDLRKDREKNKRPALTINKVRQYVNLITNNARQNKPSINIKPMGEKASYDAAQILEGLMRHIEYISSAQNIYDEATESQVEAGIGYWRIITKYLDDESFDQEILIAPVRDYLSVLLDRNIKHKDGSDGKHGFIFDDLPFKDFKRQYPEIDLNLISGADTGLNEFDDWVRDGNIRVAEYYRIVETRDELIHMEDEDGTVADFKRSEVPAKYRKRFEELGENVKTREIWNRQLEWYKIAGSQIIDRRKLKGKFIPIIRVIGIERVIEGRLERKGHVRGLKDPQRMYNYNSSGQVEYGAMGTKTQWLVATDAIAGNEVAWNNMNRDNAAYVTFKHRDEDGNEIPPPQRIEPPGTVPAFLDGMKIAAAEMEIASGQQSGQQQNPAVERTPRAIDARERSGETSTYHFIDNLAVAIRYTGRIILDLVPHIYDTERVIQILGKDGTQTNVTVKPDAATAFEIKKEQDEVTDVLFNPKVGKYEVESDVGPAYASQREQTWDAFVSLMSSDPAMLNIIGDLGFLAADFPMADKIAERIRRKIKAEAPWLLEDQPGPVMAKLTESNQKLQVQVGELLQKLAEKAISLKGKDEQKDIDVYEAQTNRMHVMGDVQKDFHGSQMEKAGLELETHKTLHDMSMDHIDQIQEDNQAALDATKDSAAQ
jgi:hypothetical protein